MAFVLWKELPRKGKARLFVKTGILFLALFNLLTCVPNIPKAHTYVMPKHLASNEQARSKTTISSLTKGEEGSSRCPKGFVYMHNRVLSNTHDERFIPKTIHFVLRSKCVPDDLAKSLHQWLVLDDYSIFYHDQEDVDKHIKAVAASRKDFAGVFSAYKCAPNSFAKLDVARFSILWSFGGITLDVDSIPGPAFMNGTIVDATDEFVVEESADPSRFLASAPKHAALYFAILHFTTRISFLYHCYEPKDGNCDYLYPGFRKQLYKDFIMGFFHGTEIPVPGNIKTEKFSNPSFMKSKIAHINLEKGGVGQLLLPALNMSNETLHEANLKTLSIHDKSLECDALHKHNAKEDPFEVDIKTLLEVSGITQQHKNTCPEGLTYIGSTFDPKSLLKGRHIPKLVHMTSKTKCFTDAFESNINKWRFDGYSFFMHDDDAVQRLFGRDWPEFPLLQEILSCVDTGAGLADVWRYLVLWEYGGIYTDIDNAPGDLFANGTVIHDQMDSFFEQEREGFPSQYFFAGKPIIFLYVLTLFGPHRRIFIFLFSSKTSIFWG